MPGSNDRNMEKKYWKNFLLLLFVLYMLLLCQQILFKKPWHEVVSHFRNFTIKSVKDNMHQSNLVPFATIKLYWNSHIRTSYKISNLLGNLAGFVPLGIFLPLLSRRFQSARTILIVLGTSLLFEVIQLVAVLGSFDVDDLLLNTVGGTLGYALFVIVAKLNRKPVRG